MNLHTTDIHSLKNNRLELPDTKDNGTIITSVKNCDNLAELETEIHEKLKANNGEKAIFTYWHEGKCYIANYTLIDFEDRCYIDYLNKDKNFKKDTAVFKSYEDAKVYGYANIENFNLDMIHYKF